MKNTYIILAILLISLTISCRKQIPNISDPRFIPAASIVDEFDLFWNGMNNNYVFWDVDTTDWDAVYKKYRPLFEELEVNDAENMDTAYKYYQEMCKGLIDSHLSITFYNYSRFMPSGRRYGQSPDYHKTLPGTYFEEIMSKKYLDEGFMLGKDSSPLDASGESQVFAIAGTVNNDVVYLYLSSFALSGLQDDSPVLTTIAKFLELAKRENTKGVIFDVRSNSGGFLRDMNKVVSNLVSEKYLFAYTRGKGGVGRLDYTPWVPEYIIPNESSLKLTVPIVVLANNYSASMAEMTVAAIEKLPNGHFVGERTWGGEGQIIDMFMGNGGQFKTSNITVYASSRAFKFADGNIYEGVGLTPDIEVLHDEAKFAAGIDTQLERAVQLVNTGK